MHAAHLPQGRSGGGSCCTTRVLAAAVSRTTGALAINKLVTARQSLPYPILGTSQRGRCAVLGGQQHAARLPVGQLLCTRLQQCLLGCQLLPQILLLLYS